MTAKVTVLLLPLAEMKWLIRYAADVVLAAAAAAIDEVLERERYCRFVLCNSRTTDAAAVCGLVGDGVADRNVKDDAISLQSCLCYVMALLINPLRLPPPLLNRGMLLDDPV